MKKTFAIALAVILLAGCQSRENQALMKRSSSGKTCEVLLAADKIAYSGDAREVIDSILKAPQQGLPQDEPMFSVINIPVSSLHNTQMFQMHRNIILCDIAEGNPDKLYINHDRWASPQVMFDIAASSPEALKHLLRVHANTIKKELYKTEHQRIINAFYGTRNVDLMKRVKDAFGFEMTFSDEFRWADGDDGFAWIRKETKDFSLGILINVSPYNDKEQFSDAKIENRIDTIMRRHVPGPAEDSYMGTERRIEISHTLYDYPGSEYCIETRGLWRVFGDFMGGPFVTYTILSPDKKSIIDVTGFVYCPRFDKRDYLMQVDGICNSVKWE